MKLKPVTARFPQRNGGHTNSTSRHLPRSPHNRMTRASLHVHTSSRFHNPRFPQTHGRLFCCAPTTMRSTVRALSAASPVDHLTILAKHWSPAVPRAPKGNNIVVSHGAGAWLTDIAGRKYLDFQCGIGVANTGHCHPGVAAVRDQVGKGIHLQQNCCISQPVVSLIERLVDGTPPGIDRFFFNATGAEAVESAIKLARHETGKQNVIHFAGGFHGRSLATLAATTSKGVYRVGYGPLPSGFHSATFPYCAQCKCEKPVGGGCCDAPLESIRQLLKEATSPSETAAVLIEVRQRGWRWCRVVGCACGGSLCLTPRPPLPHSPFSARAATSSPPLVFSPGCASCATSTAFC